MNLFPDEIPLRWPEGWPRTSPDERLWMRVREHDARHRLLETLGELGVSDARLSLSASRAEPGVACYFTVFGNPCVLASDCFTTPGANIGGIAKCIDTLAALQGNPTEAALRRMIAGLREDAYVPDWCKFFGFDAIPPRSRVEKAHKRMAFHAHPDRGGSPARMRALGENMSAARAYYDKRK